MLDLCEFFCELLTHSTVQILDHADQRLLGFDQVIMLVFQKLVTLGEFLVILNCIDIDIPEFADLLF